MPKEGPVDSKETATPEAVVESVSEACSESTPTEGVWNLGMDQFRELNPDEDIPDNFFIIMYGMRRCGKSTAMKRLLYDMRKRIKNYRAFLFSSTARIDPEQYDFIPKKFQYSDIEQLDDQLTYILDAQERTLDVPQDQREKVAKENKVLIILDDVVNENTIRHSNKLNYLAVAGRHISASVIILSQVVHGSGSVPPIIRTQADMVMLCCLPRSSKERDLLCEWYLTTDKDKTEAATVVEYFLSVKYRVMCVSMTDSSARRTKDFCFRYGPVPVPPTPPGFKIGLKEQWVAQDDRLDNAQNNPTPTWKRKGKDLKNKADKDATVNDGKDRGIIAVNQGTYKANLAQTKTSVKSIKKRKRADDSYLPPALTPGFQPTFRSFVPTTFPGASNQFSHVKEWQDDGIVKTQKVWTSAGWIKEKPEKRKPSDIVQSLQGPLVHEIVKDWANLRKKRSMRPSQAGRILNS